MADRKIKKSFQNPHKDRRPVLRYRAGQNVIITLLSFAFSVSGTRLFLELTGYPQLGGGSLHIAHVLWGGLFLFVAALLPVIYVNEWVATLSALIAGLGVGLFIDEVGKFITSTNDYFYPSAAPIIYVFFLLTVLLASQVRLNRPKSSRAKMYEILERFSEVLDRDLSSYEREELVQSLSEIQKDDQNKDLGELSKALRDYLTDQKSHLHSVRPNFLDRLRIGLLRFERRKIPRKRLRFSIIIGLLGSGIWASVSPLFFFSISRNADQLQTFLEKLISNNLVRNASGLNWFEARVLMEGGLGLVSILAAILILTKKEKLGTWIGLVGLLVAICLINLLVFYFDQFSTIGMATFQFLVLILLLRYRQRFLDKDK